MSQIIFDITRRDWKYKGVLFAEVDNNDLSDEMEPPPNDWIAGIMLLIWTDENGIWNAKMRIKYPLGNKSVFSRSYDKDQKVNETSILQEFYNLPMTNKKWYKNEDGTPQGILKIIEDANMIDHFIIIPDLKS